MNTDLTVVVEDQMEDLDPIRVSTRDMAEVLNMEHKTVLRDFKTMYVEIDGGDDLLAHRITGGLTKREYIRSNISTLFPELLELKDGTNGYHPIFKGLQIDYDSRGYTTEIIMGKSAARAFGARINSVEAVKLSTYVDFLEEENVKKRIEAASKRVETIYRIPNFSDLDNKEKKECLKHATIKDFNRELVGDVLKIIVGVVGKEYNIPTTPKKEPTILYDDKSIVDYMEKDNDSSKKFLQEKYNSMKDSATMSVASFASMVGMTSKTMWNFLYRGKFLKNGLSQTMDNYHTYNKKHHREPYATFANRGYFFLKKYNVGTTNHQTRITRGGFKYFVGKVTGYNL